MPAGGIGATSVAPDQDGKEIAFTELAEILRAENGVCVQRGLPIMMAL